jgi:hypothetical protein
VVAGATAAAWCVARLLAGTRIDGSAALLSTALLALAGGMRFGTLLGAFAGGRAAIDHDAEVAHVAGDGE